MQILELYIEYELSYIYLSVELKKINYNNIILIIIRN